jgi:Domain of unknown function (DUF929)
VSTKNGSPKATTSTASGQTAAQKRLAAQKALAAASRSRSERRRRLMTVIGPIAGVLLVVIALVIVKLATGAGGPKSGEKASAASSGVISAVTSVPANVLNTVAAGTIKTPPSSIGGAPLTADGKPRILYVGAEYCPYCAAERWAMVVALSRFGTFSGLGQTASSPSDVFPSTPTLTFHGASYSSKYLSFTGKEIQSNQVVNGQYAPLGKLSSADQSLMTTYDGGGGIPFIDIGGKYVISGASYNPQTLHGMTHKQVAAALSDPTSPVAKAIDGTANVITAAICNITGHQPINVCTAPGVTAAKAKLSSG